MFHKTNFYRAKHAIGVISNGIMFYLSKKIMDEDSSTRFVIAKKKSEMRDLTSFVHTYMRLKITIQISLTFEITVFSVRLHEEQKKTNLFLLSVKVRKE